MAKDFYKLVDGKLKHKVVMGMSHYGDYRKNGWTTHIPDPDDVPLSQPDPFEGMENDPDMQDVVKKIKADKKKPKTLEDI